MRSTRIQWDCFDLVELFGTEHEKRGCVGNASRPLRHSNVIMSDAGGSDVIGSKGMAMAGDPGHGLAFFHSGVFLFLPTSLLYTST